MVEQVAEQTVVPARTEFQAVLEKVNLLRSKYPKILFDLIPPIPYWELWYVYTMGATKHAPNGWLEQPMRYGELFGRIDRHLNKIRQGEMFCLEDGQMHAASIAWAGLTLCQYQIAGIGEDDRAIYLPKGMEVLKK